MRNPLARLWCCGQTWRKLRQYPGLFSLSDACMQLNRVIVPKRVLDWRARIGLRRQVHVFPSEGGVFEIRLLNRDLRFFWPEAPDRNLYFLIEQELNSRNPHHYTSPPIVVSPRTLILDVGACEGLFAFRTLKHGLARQVICFEPMQAMAQLIKLGARANGVSEAITVESLAVDETPGRVGWNRMDNLQANRIDGASSTTIESVSLDDYCHSRGIVLDSHDLIKIDAEGYDFRVLRGADQLIRSGAPQIAVTTYHCDDHVFEIVNWLKERQPTYRMRLKGFSCWTNRPRPVLLQASTSSPAGFQSAGSR